MANGEVDLFEQTLPSLQRQISPCSNASHISEMSTLTPQQTACLEAQQRKTENQYQRSSTRVDHRDSHQEIRPPSIVTALISGAINWLLMFGLCCAYGMIIFSDDWHLQHRTLGVKMNLATAFFVGMSLSLSSKIQVAIGGPDLNPVVFLAGFVDVIGENIASQLGLRYPSQRRLSPLLDYCQRRLANDEGFGLDFCVGEHLNLNPLECSQYHEQLRATVIFATMVSSATLGVLFFCIGRFKLTRLVRYVPTCIMEAFLSCVGYKVFKYALKFCKFDAAQFVPAAFVGVLVYFLKALHIGNPAVMIPTMLLTPLAIFYGIVYGSGSSLDEVRGGGFMFPEMEDVAFWKVWTDGLGNFDKINYTAWLQTLPDLAVMVVVCLLDCLLKLSGTETKLPVKVDQNFEVSLHGLSNIFTVACGSSVGYMQLKFNVINYGIVGNVGDRRGGLFYALLCGVCFFGTVEHFNLQPRFFLGMLLFFAGSGFVAENLWGSRAYLTSREWMQIFAILGVFVFTERLVYAVSVGGLLTCIDFIATYAKISCVLGEPMRGGELSTEERYDPVLQQNLQYIKNAWLLLIKLKGFVFFGSAQSLIAYVQSVIEHHSAEEEYKRLRFIVFDCKLLDGMDVSASKSFRKIVAEAAAIGIRVLWSHVQPCFVQELKQRQILMADEDWFVDLREAIIYVERRAVKYLKGIQARWLSVHPALALYKKSVDAQANFEPFEDILTLDTMRNGCPWLYCNRIELVKNTTLLWEPGQLGIDLFLIHTGAVALYTTLPGNNQSDEWPMPVAIYRHGWFINCDMITGSRTRHYAVALESGEAVCWCERQWYRMTCEQPQMSSAISKAVMKQQKADWELLEKDADQAFGNTAPVPASSTVVRGAGGRKSLSLATIGLKQVVPCDKDGTQIPDKLQSRIYRLHTTQVLHQLGLFSPPVPPCAVSKPSGKLDSEQGEPLTAPSEREQVYCKAKDCAFFPDLPVHLAQSLKISFAVYGSLDPENPMAISAFHVRDALLYAGIPDALLADDQNHMSFTWEHFLLLGKSAVMARFSGEQLANVKKIFKYFDADGSGELDRSELDVVMRQLFFPCMSIEEIDGMAQIWDDDGSGSVDEEEFCKIASRLVRQRQLDWLFLNALRELSGDMHLDITDESQALTIDAISANSRSQLAKGQVEEMLWAVDWRQNGLSGSCQLKLHDVLAVVVMRIQEPSGALPPEHPSSKPSPASSSPYARQEMLWTRSERAFEIDRMLQRSSSSIQDSIVRDNVKPSLSESPLVSTLAMSSATGFLPSTPPATIDEGSREERSVNSGLNAMGEIKCAKCGLLLADWGSVLADMVLDMRVDSVRKHALNDAWGDLEAFNETEDLERQISFTSTHSSSSPLVSQLEQSLSQNKFSVRLYRLLYKPQSSLAAKLWWMFMLSTVLVSLVALILRPLLERQLVVETFSFWNCSEIYFTVLFSFELALRYFVARNLGTHTFATFCMELNNFCDIVALLPHYSELFLNVNMEAFQLLRIGRLVRLTSLMNVVRISWLCRRPICEYLKSVTGAICTVFAVIWGIYLKSKDD